MPSPQGPASTPPTGSPNTTSPKRMPKVGGRLKEAPAAMNKKYGHNVNPSDGQIGSSDKGTGRI